MYYVAGEMQKELNQNKRPQDGYKSEEESRSAWRPEGYTHPFSPPIPIMMTFQEFWRTTAELDRLHPAGSPQNFDHYYVTTGDSWDRAGKTPVSKEVKMFRTREGGLEPELFMKSDHDVRGIHVRIGHRGVVAESHWDGHLNYVFIMRGAKRYILSPPESCRYMEVMDEGASRRHAAMDFSDPNLLTCVGNANARRAAQLNRAEAVEAVVKAGDALFIPSYWLHYIISLERSVQGNVRSGISPTYGKDADGLNDCERGVPPRPVSDEEVSKARAIAEKYAAKTQKALRGGKI
jgi:Cupin-like domain